MQLHEQAKYWHAPEQIELLSAFYVTHRFIPHTHDTFAIGVIGQGAEAFYYRGQTHIAPMGHIVLVNPDEIHTGYAVTQCGWMYRMFYPTAELMSEIHAEITGKAAQVPFFSEPVVYNPTISALMWQAHHAFEHSPDPLERAALLRMAFSALILQYADRRPISLHPLNDHTVVQQARHYLETHYAQPITLDILSHAVSMSPFHLNRLFSAQVGLPPHAYLMQWRIRNATPLLRQGMPLAQVALAVGFANQSHFTRWFKQIVGVTPGHYARSA
ncbi:MAG: AraC family transcriptional regulator [Anaerolineae bacterium]|jgi:AraC-like DNA-binding protein|nr:AraC family transcriptional regulator [Anaerolineae bacterium]